MPLSGGADVILQELRLDLILKVSKEGSVGLLTQEQRRENERKRGEERGFKIYGKEMGEMMFSSINNSREERTAIHPHKHIPDFTPLLT